MKLRCIALTTGLLVALSMPATASLSLEDESQRLLMATETAVAEGRWGVAMDYMNRLLRKEQVTLPPDFYFLRGRIMEEAGQPREARQAYGRYVSSAGREGDMYQTALRRITVIEEQERQRGDKSEQFGREPRGGNGEAMAVTLEAAGADEVAQLKALYLTDDPVEALIEHANSLLGLHAWEGPSRVVVRQPDRGLHYRLRLDDTSLQLRTREVDDSGNARVSVTRLNVFGINPRVGTECYREESACWIADPRDGSRWLKLAENRAAATETARVISLLLREIQKNR
ncbi:MAG: hypothetical protein EA349_12855 [Halomonadaceae bacterium]|nr:MAG: hypothetical protein EA349_12855 [Halomonadaceae bacterium]